MREDSSEEEEDLTLIAKKNQQEEILDKLNEKLSVLANWKQELTNLIASEATNLEMT